MLGGQPKVLDVGVGGWVLNGSGPKSKSSDGTFEQ